MALYDAIKKGYTKPSELLASAAWGSGVEFKDKEEKASGGLSGVDQYILKPFTNEKTPLSLKNMKHVKWKAIPPVKGTRP